MNQQPEALHWAEWLDDLFDADGEPKAAAAELRRLHEENEALRKQLKHAELAASAEASIVDELQAELQEQARVNGIGSERELKLMAENEALRKDAEHHHLLILSVEEAMKNGVLPIDVEAAYAAMKGQS